MVYLLKLNHDHFYWIQRELFSFLTNSKSAECHQEKLLLYRRGDSEMIRHKLMLDVECRENLCMKLFFTRFTIFEFMLKTEILSLYSKYNWVVRFELHGILREEYVWIFCAWFWIHQYIQKKSCRNLRLNNTDCFIQKIQSLCTIFKTVLWIFFSMRHWLVGENIYSKQFSSWL